MPLIQVPKSVMPCQVDVPDSVKDRSRPGSLHFRPGVKRVTVEEWEHVSKANPGLAKQCTVVPVDETKTKGALKKAEEAKKVEAEKPKPLLDKRAKDHPTKRQRKLAELEARQAGFTPEDPAVKKLPAEEEAAAKPADKSKDKDSKDKKTTNK